MVTAAITTLKSAGDQPNYSGYTRNWILYVGSALALVAFLFRDAHSLRYLDRWAREDQGGHLVLNQLLGDGLKPNVDFGFPYGPLTVLSCQAWAAIFGNHWQSFSALLLVFRVISTLLLVSIIARLSLSPWLQALFVLGLLRWLTEFNSIAHFGEQVGLFLAVRCLLSSRIDLALAGCTLATLFRPAAGFIVGVMLVAVLLWQAASQPQKNWLASTTQFLRALLPSALLEFAIAAIYIPLHGLNSYALTLFPFTGARTYAQMPGSYFSTGLGRFFPMNQGWKGYFANPTYLDFIVLLVIAAGLIVGAFLRLSRSPPSNREPAPPSLYIALLSAGLVVATALTICYAQELGLEYYKPFFWLAFFVAWKQIGSRLGNLGFAMVVLMGLNLIAFNALSLPGVPHLLSSNADVYADSVQLPDSHLLLRKAEYEELQTLGDKLGGRTVDFPSYMGDVTMLSTIGINALPNKYWCLNKGLSLPEELAATRRQSEKADFFLLKKPLRRFACEVLQIDNIRTQQVADGQYYKLLQVDRTLPKVSPAP